MSVSVDDLRRCGFDISDGHVVAPLGQVGLYVHGRFSGDKREVRVFLPFVLTENADVEVFLSELTEMAHKGFAEFARGQRHLGEIIWWRLEEQVPRLFKVPA